MESAVVLEAKPKGNSNTTFEKTVFVDKQAAKRAEATRGFETSMEKAVVEVTKVCSAVRALAKQQEEQTLEYEYEQASAATKSLMQLKKEAADRKALLARSEQEARMLTPWGSKRPE